MNYFVYTLHQKDDVLVGKFSLREREYDLEDAFVN